MAWLELGVTGVLLLLNAFFVLAEFAFIKIRPSRVQELSRKGGLTGTLVEHIFAHIDAYLATIQLGITMASLGIGWVGEPAVARLLEPLFRGLPSAWLRAASVSISFGAAFFVITLLHVVLGENVPKLVAIRRPAQWAQWTAAPLHFCHKLFYVPMALLNAMAGLVLRLTGQRSADPSETAHSDEEL